MCPNKPLSIALGKLGVCPTEILFRILDEMLWSSPHLHHEGFCAITKLMNTNPTLRQVVKAWMSGRKVHSYITKCVNNQWCLNPSSLTESMIWQLLVHQKPFHVENDLITGVIRDDCVDCYELLPDLMPEEEKFPDNMSTCINEQGWTFFALAVHARAWTVLSNHRVPGCHEVDHDVVH